MAVSAVPQLSCDIVDAVGAVVDTVAPAADEIDRTGTFPRANLDALGEAGILGLCSARARSAAAARACGPRRPPSSSARPRRAARPRWSCSCTTPRPR